ncbi:VOC family protein [Bacillus ndiopicus]|uniref:VOC family protein n=1 Tax=Bacillus ndiopicus TaxID=1347368 RepID=UPI0005AA8C2D|nr:VOC family protein [Bacillus ndiopicus]
MIHQIGQIMLYVNDQDEAVKFWTEKIGFVVLKDEENHGMRMIEIAPSKDVQTSFVLHNKALIAQMQPELNLGTPSIMFYAENVEALYEKFKAKGITVGDLITIPAGKLFNFADSENNYFALIEKD